MNSQERDALNVFLQQLTQAQIAQRDPDADALIAQALVAQPHAGYLLVQRAMQLDYVLQQTQAKVAQLQAELDREKSGTQTSFLNDVHAWGRAPSQAGAMSADANQAGRQPQHAAMAQAPVPTASAPSAPVAATPASTPTSWGSSMMGNVATTAAGVVAGSFLFQGIQNMMGHSAGGGLGGGGFGNNAATNPAAPVTMNETTVNNYYTNDPATDQGAYTGGTALADASDDFDIDSDSFGSDDSDFA